MKALSIKQPWAQLIVDGHKDIENRRWKTTFRGRIYVHASKTEDNSGYHWLHGKALDHKLPKLELLLPLTRGAIIGEVTIVACVTMSNSPWFFKGSYGYVLANPIAYDVPIPCRGQLGFFEVDHND